MNGADLLVKSLENEGVEYIFGLPGEENLLFLESLRKSSIKLILTRHEQAAGFMAATYGRLTGRPGVCLATLGPGATNLVTSISHALLGGMPSVFITGQKPIKKSKQGRFQIIDIVRMMKPVTKMSRQIVSGDSIPATVREAFRQAMEEKEGPVHLELPEDIAAETSTTSPFKVTNAPPARASQEAMNKVIPLIQKAKNPLLMIAAAANRHQNCHSLREMVERTGIYFFATQMGKGVINEYSNKCLGTAALSDHDYLHCAINKADLIINVGHDVVEKPPFFMNHNGLEVIHINYYSATIDPVYFPQHELIGDISETIKEISKRIKPDSLTGDGYFTRIQGEINKHILQKNTPVTFPPSPQQLVTAIREVVPEDSILSLDNGMYKIWFARNYKATTSYSLLLDNALATMGAGLPVAIAAKMIHPGKKVIAICGDGGFMMNSQEIETALRLNLDLLIIILKDNGYGMIRWKQAEAGLPDFGFKFNNPDFVAYARSYGAGGYRLDEESNLRDLLTELMEKPGVNLLEIPVDYSENESVLIKELKEKTCLL